MLTLNSHHTVPDAYLIGSQSEIQWLMRPHLLHFLIDAHTTFALLLETLFLSVNLLDQYCSKRVVYKKHYQLVGCAALLIAAKYGDDKDRIPKVDKLTNMGDGRYDATTMTHMEIHTLETLDWIIGHPTVNLFLQLIAAEEGEDQEVKHMATYLCEFALCHRKSVSTNPSVMARSSLSLARAVLARYKVDDGQWERGENMAQLMQLLRSQQPSTTLVRKYSTAGLSQVSQKLDSFLAQQANIAPYAVNPATRHTESAPERGSGATVEVCGYQTLPYHP